MSPTNDNDPKPKSHYIDPEHYDPYADDTLEIGDTDRTGNKHPDHDKYEAEMERRHTNLIQSLPISDTLARAEGKYPF